MAGASAEAARVAHPESLYIDGTWHPVSGSQRLRPVNPATEEVVAEVAAAGPVDVELAVSAARRAFDSGPWPRMAAGERAKAMRALAACLVKRGEALDSCWLAQIGIPVAIAAGSALTVWQKRFPVRGENRQDRWSTTVLRHL